MMPWLILFFLFGLVAYEQMSLVPLIVPSILFVVVYPLHRSLVGTIKRGGKGTGDVTFVFILLMIPLFLAIISTWRGGN